MERKSGLLMAFGPHPDDVELNIGGIVALHALEQEVVIVDLTEGELASNGTVEQRQGESMQAANILKATARVNLHLPDSKINPHDQGQQREVVTVIRHYRPEIVLVPYWKDRHPDHVAASQLIDTAIFMSGLKLYETGELLAYRPRGVYYYLQHQHGMPDLIVDISNIYEVKMAAIAAYESQFSPDSFPTYINQPAFMQKIRARDEYFGAIIGARYGEGLMCKQPLTVKNLFQLL